MFINLNKNENHVLCCSCTTYVNFLKEMILDDKAELSDIEFLGKEMERVLRIEKRLVLKAEEPDLLEVLKDDIAGYKEVLNKVDGMFEAVFNRIDGIIGSDVTGKYK